MRESTVKLVELGACMYMPALNASLVEVGNGWKYGGLRSLIFCTEDSVAERDLAQALGNLSKALIRLEPASLKRFVRPRNQETLRTILSFKGLENIDGFVIPKADLSNLPDYFSLIERHERFAVMITIETATAFDLPALYRLRDYLSAHPLRDRMTAIRIGALDLLSLLGLRREPGQTIYDTPLRHVVDQMITVFRPAGFQLAASGCEFIETQELLAEELNLDLSRGLMGKTALHPDQIGVINSAYMVSRADLAMARAVNDPARPAVFRLHGRMCEKAVHANWAAGIEARANIYGVREEVDACGPVRSLDLAGLA
ncbi:MAG: HpcH/HpaI aldolase/citrate lyase family protein [Deltaproteobacteria bacterium]|jgi:citrate lyase beta subunit|nr:HpcH/HpaI aldolase/citrate lyase family protein [Deltaproteobacteria bacterium]